MPTLLLLNGFRFFFYSNENEEPIHVHISKGDAEGKIWLEPGFRVCYFHGFSKAEEKNIQQIAMENSETFKQKWNEYFDK